MFTVHSRHRIFLNELFRNHKFRHKEYASRYFYRINLVLVDVFNERASESTLLTVICLSVFNIMYILQLSPLLYPIIWTWLPKGYSRLFRSFSLYCSEITPTYHVSRRSRSTRLGYLTGTSVTFKNQNRKTSLTHEPFTVNLGCMHISRERHINRHKDNPNERWNQHHNDH